MAKEGPQNMEAGKMVLLLTATGKSAEAGREQ